MLNTEQIINTEYFETNHDASPLWDESVAQKDNQNYKVVFPNTQLKQN